MAIEDTLDKVELFRELEPGDLSTLAKIVVEREFKAGEVIVKEGEPGVALYVVAKGRVEAIKGLGSSNEQVIATFSPGDFFGEMALFDDSPRSATIRATEDSQFLVMSKWDLSTAIKESDGRVAQALLAVLARRIRRLTDAATH